MGLAKKLQSTLPSDPLTSVPPHLKATPAGEPAFTQGTMGTFHILTAVLVENGGCCASTLWT